MTEIIDETLSLIMELCPSAYENVVEIIHKKIDKLFAQDVLFIEIDYFNLTIQQVNKIKEELKYRSSEIGKFLFYNPIDIQYILDDSELLQKFVDCINELNKANHYITYFVKNNKVHQKIVMTNHTNIINSQTALVTILFCILYDKYVLDIADKYLLSFITNELK
jgi:hypothetical protein